MTSLLADSSPNCCGIFFSVFCCFTWKSDPGLRCFSGPGGNKLITTPQTNPSLPCFPPWVFGWIIKGACLVAWAALYSRNLPQSFLNQLILFVQWVVSSGLLLNDYWDPRWVSRPMRVSSMLQFLLLRCSIVLYSLHPSIWLWFFHNHQLTYSAKDGWWWPGKLVHIQCKIWIGTSSHSETLQAPCLSIILIDDKNPDISDGGKIF